MTVPLWVWAVSAGGLVAAVAAEIVLTGRPGRESFTARQAIGWVAVYVSLAAACGLAIGVTADWVTAGQFYAGYLTEYSLSLDNLFVFAVIMTWFAVPPARQPRVLLLGIGLALAMRSAVIVAGAAALNRFGWLFYPLGGVLLWTAADLIASARARPEREAERHTRLTAWLRRRRPWARGSGGADGATGPAPVLLLAAAIGLADLLFAFDSIPAIFGITTSAALVVACNAFALMGLRQLYVLVAGLLSRIAMLSHMDANHDAEISREEFVTFIGRAIKDRPGFDTAVRTTARALIEVADADGNGVLDAGEYTMLAAACGVGAEEAVRDFGRFDRDGSGTLEIAELSAAICQFFASRDVGTAGSVATAHG